MPFQKGQSGNPSGRPPRDRALTNILEAELNKTVDRGDGVRVARKRLIAQLMAQIVTEGRVTMPDGRELVVSDLKELADILKWVYRHVDGEKSHIDITTLGQSVVQRVEVIAPADEPVADE